MNGFLQCTGSNPKSPISFSELENHPPPRYLKTGKEILDSVTPTTVSLIRVQISTLRVILMSSRRIIVLLESVSGWRRLRVKRVDLYPFGVGGVTYFTLQSK